MKRFITVLVFAGFMLYCVVPASAEEKIKVTFINPGVSNSNDPTGGFWGSVTAFMQAAADDLNIELEVIYSERNHISMKKQVKKVAARKELPDYLVIVNEKQAAGEMVEVADKAGIKTFMMLNVFVGEQAEKYGQPREKYPNWIGTLIPNNRSAGYQVGKLVIERALEAEVKASDGKLHIVAIAGDRATQASVERVEGLEKALSEYFDVDLKQIFYAEWRKDKAYEQAERAFKRYPETAVLWGANDPIALGGMEGAMMNGKNPGKDLFVGGLNWDAPGLEKVKDGAMVTSVGGHFMTGGWVMVLLHDYHHGKDFAEEGVALQRQIFCALHKNNLDTYLAKLGDRDWSKIDFTKFSKVMNPEIKEYDFGLEPILVQEF